MYGIIMAGGQGTRLYPLTHSRPKPMVEVLGRPVIDFVKDAMVAAGITDIVVTTGYRGEQLASHVASWAGEGDCSLLAEVNQEEMPMGTAGSVGLLRDRLTSTFVVGSGDAIASFDIQALLRAHRQNNAKVTMALWEVEDPSEFGIVGLASTPDGVVDGGLREGFIRQFLEKPSPEEAFSTVINAGLYVLEPEVFAHLPEGTKFDFSRDLFPILLAQDWPMYAKAIDGVWFDVGQPNELLRAQKTLMEDYASLPFSFPAGFNVWENDTLVGPSTAVGGTVTRSTIGGFSMVERGAHVTDSLLMDGCMVHSGAVVKDSVLGTRVVVPNGARVEGCVIGDGVVLSSSATYQGQRIPNEGK